MGPGVVRGEHDMNESGACVVFDVQVKHHPGTHSCQQSPAANTDLVL